MSYHNSVSSLGGALNSLFKHLLSEIHTLSLNSSVGISFFQMKSLK